MMTDMVNTRELALNILLQIEKEKVPSHMAIRQMLEKYQFLPKQDRAFITRLCEGSVEYQIQNDYVINQYSKMQTGDPDAASDVGLSDPVYGQCAGFGGGQ